MSGVKTSEALLGDFRTDSRMLLLVAFALPLGVISAFVAKALLWLIAEITNIVFFQRFSPEMETLQHHHLGAWVIAAPVVGALIIGLMARYGSEKIRGHGIPEAIEAMLLGGSLIRPKVAILKPISSAVSIGTGGPFGAEGPIIMTGGAIGSILAQLFHLTAAERKTLLHSRRRRPLFRTLARRNPDGGRSRLRRIDRGLPG
jgi:chloride channel protein, CIC family